MKQKNLIAGVVIIGIILAIGILQSTFSTTIPPQKSSGVILTNETVLAEKAMKYASGVDFVQPSGFLNSEPFSLKDVVGKKVILIDFWTYSCINCIRTQPYLNAWHKQYEDDGLLIVGVHTPEFDFERDIENVRTAVTHENILYPVVLDNDYGTWRAYNNRYWPRKYLIDIDGFIVYDTIGEGNYDKTEDAIRAALDERRERLGLEDLRDAMVAVAPEYTTDFTKPRTPELYFGTNFDRGQCGNCAGSLQIGTASFSVPRSMIRDTFYFNGTWSTTTEYSEAVTESSVTLLYTSKDVYAVLGTRNTTGSVRIYSDGVFEREIAISDQTLYTLVNSQTYSSHELRIELSPGVQLYTYTFG